MSRPTTRLAFLAGLGALGLSAPLCGTDVPGLAETPSRSTSSVAAPFLKDLSRRQLALSASRAEIQKVHRELGRPDLEEPQVRELGERRTERRKSLQTSLHELAEMKVLVRKAIDAESAKGILQIKFGLTGESPEVRARLEATRTLEDLLKALEAESAKGGVGSGLGRDSPEVQGRLQAIRDLEDVDRDVGELMMSAYDFLVREERIYRGLADAHRDRFGGRNLGRVGLAGLAVLLLGAVLLGLARLRKGKASRSTLAALTGAGSGGNILANNYQVVREVAEGGWATVYEAVDLALQRKVAVKKLHARLRRDPKQARQFLNEARLVAALKHPNIVEIHHILEENGDIYLVFEYIEGETLHSLLLRKGRLALAEAKGILLPICKALEYAHGQGIIHRDLKPTNIMIPLEGTAKVTDFGIAHQAKVAAALSRASAIGTPAYMAPEQETGHVVLESDLYALGACLYEVLTGELPFPGPDFASQKRSLRFPPATRRNPELPKEADAVLHKALQPDYRQRFRSAAEFGRWLSSLGEGDGPSPHPIPSRRNLV